MTQAPVLLRATLEQLRFEAGQVALAGWALAPEVTSASLWLEVDGELRGELARAERPDVARAFPSLPHAVHSGLFGTFADVSLPNGAWRLLAIVARNGGRELARCEFFLPADPELLGPAPPPELMHRVAHVRDAALFRNDGLRAAREVLVVLRRRGLATSGALLDWGCGCGRVLVPLAAQLPAWRLAGVDVDRDAIAWLQRARADLELRPIAFDPPTALAAGSFDVVLGLSVMTHLERTAQQAWLAELRRLLAPGGLALLSVHGARALQMAGDRHIATELGRAGISDSLPDTTLVGVVDRLRYRATFQTEAWTRTAWREGFELLEWIDGGLGGFQDLVLLQAS